MTADLEGLYVAHDAIREMAQEADLTLEATWPTPWGELAPAMAERRGGSAGFHGGLLAAKHRLQELILERGGVVGDAADHEDWDQGGVS